MTDQSALSRAPSHRRPYAGPQSKLVNGEIGVNARQREHEDALRHLRPA